MYSWQFSKKFPRPKNGSLFEFSNFCLKWQNTKLLLSPKPCEIERFRRNFRPTGYVRNEKKMEKQKFPYLLNRARLTVKIFDPTVLFLFEL